MRVRFAIPSLRALAASSVLLLLPGVIARAGAAPQGVLPRPELAPAIAGGARPALAFTGDDGHPSPHVHAALPAWAVPVELGPAWPGADGAPALTETDSGAVLVVAARDTGSGRVLWSQRHDGAAWLPPLAIPGTDRDSRLPALASAGGATWLVWMSGDLERRHKDLVASRWLGNAWSTPETIPAGPGQPMAPAIAVGRDGLPVALWAARDGTDAEIWLSRRSAAGWSRPLALTRNHRADLMPSAAFAGSDLVVAWASGDANGYRPWAAVLGPRQRRARPVALAPAPGNAPKAAGIPGGVIVAWSSPAPGDPRSSELRRARWDGRSWSRATPIATALNARTAIAGGDEGGWLTAWHDGRGVAAAEVREVPATDVALPVPLRGELTRPASRQLELSLPGTYLAFGDSLTAGLVRNDGEISFVEGYAVHLGRMISDHINQSIVIDERAVPGELTAEAFGRLRGTILGNPRDFVLLHEGANDISVEIDVQTIADNLLGMGSSVRDTGGLPVFSTLLPRAELDFAGGNTLAIIDLNALLRVSTVPIGPIVDLYPGFFGKYELYSDPIHPNEQGYAVMAAMWFRGLLPILNRLLRDQDVTPPHDEDLLPSARAAAGSRRR